MTVAFTSWAGVVWQGWQDVRELLFEVNTSMATVVVRIEHIDSQLMSAKDIAREHRDKPWHDQAGNALGIIRLEVDNLRERIDKLENGG